MSVVLIYPPFVSNQGGPPAGLSALGPYLNRNGIATRLLDLNIEFFWHVWNNWSLVTDLIRARLERRLAKEGTTNSTPCRRDYHLLRLTLPLLDRWRKEFDRELKNQPPGISLFVQQSIASVMNSYYFDGVFTSGERLEGSFLELSRCVRDAVEDPLMLDFTSSHNWDSVNLVGFSLLSQSQLPYAMLIAGVLQSSLASLRTVVGGPYITEMAAGLSSEPEIFEYFDFLVVQEGESALVNIANGMSAANSHPNVVVQGEDLSGRSFFVEDIERLPEQEFSEFDMELYRPWGVSKW